MLGRLKVAAPGPFGGALVGRAVVLAVGVALYLASLRGYFQADDFIFLQQLHFSHGPVLDSFAYFGRDWGMGADFYRPLTRVFWALEYALFGESAWIWHLASAVLYGVAALLVYLLARELSQREWVGFVAGALFALHPAHAETVSWIANQSDLLAAPLCIGSALLYPRARGSNGESALEIKWPAYIGSLTCFALALLCKESAITFVAVPLLYDLLFTALKRRAWRVALARFAWRQLPFYAVLGLYLLVRSQALHGFGGYDAGVGGAASLSTSVQAYTRWLLMPLDVDRTSVKVALVLLVVLLVVSLLLFEVGTHKAHGGTERRLGAMSFRLIRTGAFGLCWLLLFFLPTITTPPSVRFVFLPSAGLSLLAGVLLAPLWAPVRAGTEENGDRGGLRGTLQWPRSTWAGVARGVLALLLAGFSMFAALQHEQYWVRGGETARSVLDGIRSARPDLPKYSIVYGKGIPDANEEALIFRTGFPHAIQMIYNNQTIQGLMVEQFPIVEAQANLAYFVEYTGAGMRARDDLVQALKQRNQNIKAKLEKPYVTWSFDGSQPSGWTLASGEGSLAIEGGKLVVRLPGGGRIRSPAVDLPATRLSWLLLSSAGPGSAPIDLTVHWLVTTPQGPVERASAPLAVNKSGTYRIKPPDISRFLIDDRLGAVEIEVPPGEDSVALGSITLYALPAVAAGSSGR